MQCHLVLIAVGGAGGGTAAARDSERGAGTLHCFTNPCNPNRNVPGMLFRRPQRTRSADPSVHDFRGRGPAHSLCDARTLSSLREHIERGACVFGADVGVQEQSRLYAPEAANTMPGVPPIPGAKSNPGGDIPGSRAMYGGVADIYAGGGGPPHKTML
eukprot:726092-Rhodomonas_salina.1